MDLNTISFASLIVALIVSLANFYCIYLFKRKIKEDLLIKHFSLLSGHIKLLEEQNLILKKEVTLNSAKVDAVEKVITALLTSSGALGGPGSENIH